MAQQNTGRRPLPSQSRRLPAPRRTATTATDEIRQWVTLREAEEATGIPASTIRNWAKKDRVDSQLDLREEGPRRMVDLSDVNDRARQLGRLEDVSRSESTDAPSGPPAPPPPSSAGGEAPVTPDDAMLVPIDAWNRMLAQLGNLHEAGQQLAEARERAAKAETETTFLRERLAEIRVELAETKNSAVETHAPPMESEVTPTRKTAWWVGAYSRWRRRH